MAKKLILFTDKKKEEPPVYIKVEPYLDGLKLVSVNSHGRWLKDILGLTPDGLALFSSAHDAGIAVDSKKRNTVKVTIE